MNLGDPELELIDPTPNIHLLFVNFDKQFFLAKLANRVVVRWSKRMYSCAGVCSYEGPYGLCDIALSEPLLKLRPRKDLVETLLHEMIHAYLFITNNDRDRDGHGPKFQSHMHRINQLAGLNISIYHSFHEEVELYQTHWWRCDGPCQKTKPYFGIIRRSANRAPCPSDFWWDYHQKKCGGTFVKIKEPEKPVKKTTRAKPNADITKYITINNNNNSKINVLQDFNNTTKKSNVGIKSNSSSTVITTKKGNISFNPKVSKPINVPVLFSGNGHILSGNRNRSNSVNALETVRNVWANKQLPTTNSKEIMRVDGRVIGETNLNPNPNKHKADSVHLNSPPTKIKKIDDYFKTNASAILKDVYGGDFKITQSDNNKLKAVSTKVEQKDHVDCPVCSLKVNNNEINRHLDECLNKDVIAQISQDNKEKNEMETNVVYHNKEEALKEIYRLENELKNKDVKKDGFLSTSIDLTNNVNCTIENKTNELINRRNNKDASKNDLFGTSIDLTSILTCPIMNIENKLGIKDVSKKDFGRSIDLTDNIIDPTKNNDRDYAAIKMIMLSAIEPNIQEDLDTARLYLPSKRTFHIPPYKTATNKLDVEKVKPIKNTTKIENIGIKSDNHVKIETKIAETIKESELLNNIKIKKEPVTENETTDLICPCCGKKVPKPVAEHLDICISFMNNNTTKPVESTSNFGIETIVVDDDDIFDETLTLNATGTKSPCPCCLEMIEEAVMNIHLDTCLK